MTHFLLSQWTGAYYYEQTLPYNNHQVESVLVPINYDQGECEHVTWINIKVWTSSLYDEIDCPIATVGICSVL